MMVIRKRWQHLTLKVFTFWAAISHATHANHITPEETVSYCSERRKESKLQAPEEPRRKTCKVLQQC